MLDALKFVQGAVAKKDYQPALTHFRIAGGRVKGYNGTIALSTPIALDITATPKALPFVKAIERCTGTTSVHVTPTGLLSLKSGKFQARIECHDEDDAELLDSIEPEGVRAEFPGVVIQALKTLTPFISEDASRPWSRGILLRGNSAYATNNIILAEYWLGQQLPEINIPEAAVAELIRIGEEPAATTIGENSITFHFENGRWLRSQLLGTSWPDLDPILSQEGDFKCFPDGFFEAVEVLKPFVDEAGRIYFREGKICTSIFDGQGASVDIEGLPAKGAFNFKHLLALQEVVTGIDFTKHPQPCPFRGERLRGAILGMVDAE